MKALLIPIVACAALSGCATYGDPYGYGYGYGNGGDYGSAYPAYPVYPAVSGSIYYSNTPSYNHGSRAYRGQYRDRDRDGVPNRMDYDRDGDGAPNNMDSRPNNPRRR